MGGNSKASVPGSSGTKQDDGSRTDKQNPTSPELSGPCQNDSQGLFQRHVGAPGKTTYVPSESDTDSTKQDDVSGTDKQKPTSPKLSGPCQNHSQGLFQRHVGVQGKTTYVPSESDTDSTVTPSEIQRSHEKRKRNDTPSEGTAKSLFGKKEKISGHEQKVSNANDAGSQKSHDQKETNDTQGHFGRREDPSSGSVPDQTPQDGDSSTTVEHSSDTKTGTEQLQSKTISKGNKSSTSEIFGRRNS